MRNCRALSQTLASTMVPSPAFVPAQVFVQLCIKSSSCSAEGRPLVCHLLGEPLAGPLCPGPLHSWRMAETAFSSVLSSVIFIYSGDIGVVIILQLSRDVVLLILSETQHSICRILSCFVIWHFNLEIQMFYFKSF